MLSARPDFLSRFGHDLRAPLSSLNSVLRLLAADVAPPESLRGALARQALAASLQLQCQIDDAITVARLESADMAPAVQAVDLRSLLHQVFADLVPVGQALEVTLYLDSADPPGSEVVSALGSIEDATVTPLLVRAMKDADPEVRRIAAEGLGQHR